MLTHKFVSIRPLVPSSPRPLVPLSPRPLTPPSLVEEIPVKGIYSFSNCNTHLSISAFIYRIINNVLCNRMIVFLLIFYCSCACIIE